MTATDTTIALRETGQYSFRIKAAACEARVTRSRTWSRKLALNDQRETPPAAQELGQESVLEDDPSATQSAQPPTPVASPNAQAKSSPDCAAPGEAHAIRLPHLVHWLEPGGSVRLDPRVVDEQGCRLPRAKVTFQFESPAHGLQVDEKTGVVRVAADAEQGSHALTMRSGDVRTVVQIPIVTEAGKAALLRAPAHTVPSAANQARPQGTQGQVGAATVQAEDKATPRKWLFAGLAGIIALGLGALGFRLLRTGTRPTGPANAAITIRSAGDAPARCESEPPQPPAPASMRRAPVSSGAEAPISPQVVTPRAVPQPATSQSSASRSSASQSLASQSFSVRSPSSMAPSTSALAASERPAPQAAGASPSARSERARISTPPPKPGAKSPLKRTAGAGVCPACGERYTDGSIFCGMDGVRLRPDPIV